jgi:hypothetical protein
VFLSEIPLYKAESLRSNRETSKHMAVYGTGRNNLAQTDRRRQKNAETDHKDAWYFANKKNGPTIWSAEGKTRLCGGIEYTAVLSLQRADISSVGRIAQPLYRLAKGWTVRWSNPDGGEIFRNCPDRPWGPPSLLKNGYRFFPGGRKRPRRDADPSLPSSAEV